MHQQQHAAAYQVSPPLCLIHTMHHAVPVMLHYVNKCLLLLLQLLLRKACLLLLLPADVNMRRTEGFVLLPSASFTVAILLRDTDVAHFVLCSD